MMTGIPRIGKVYLTLAAALLALPTASQAKPPGGGGTTSGSTTGSAVTTTSAGDYAATKFTANKDDAHGIVVQSSGKIVVTGTQNEGQSSQNGVVIRYNADFTPDTTFGSNGGSLAIPLGGALGSTAAAIAEDHSGRLVVVGSTTDAYGKPTKYIKNTMIARVKATGGMDTTWDGDGVKHADLSAGHSDTATSIAIDAAGNYVVGGEIDDASNNAQFSVVRYLSTTGAIDPAFNGGHAKAIPIPGGSSQVNAIRVDSLGRIIAVGSCNGIVSEVAFCIARLSAAGVPDPTFVGGPGTTNPTTGVVRYQAGSLDAYGLAVDASGNYVVTGNIADGTLKSYLARFSGVDGSLDTSLGGTGIVKLDLGDGAGVRNGVSAIEYEAATGDYVLAGWAGAAPNATMFIAKYNVALDQLDPSYHTVGVVNFQLPGSSYNGANALAVDATGVYVTGFTDAPLANLKINFGTAFEAN